MAETTLSRPAFYMHFGDRVDLLLALTEELTGELLERQDRMDFLAASGEPESVYANGRAAIDGLVRFYGEHITVLRALASAAHHEPRIAQAMRSIQQRFIDDNVPWIEREMNSGRAPRGDARMLSEALAIVTSASLLRWLDPREGHSGDEVAELLMRIWTGIVWCDTPEGALEGAR